MTDDHRAPLISAIVPVHNKRPYIERALASIAAQTRPPGEVVIVDDASTDGSLDPLPSFALPGLRVLRRESASQSAARNLAITEATGEWVAFLDADDEWRPTHLETITRLVEGAGPEVGFAFTGYEVVEPHSHGPSPSTRLLAGMTSDGQPLEIDLDAFLDLWLRLGRAPLCMDVVAVRRRVLIDAGLFADRCHRGADVDLWLRVMSRTRARAVPDLGATFFRDPGRIPPWQLPDGGLCLKATVDELLLSAQPATARRLRRLYNQYAYLYLRRRAGVGPMPRAARAGYFVRDDPIHYLAIRTLELLPARLAGRVRAGRRAR